MGASLRFWVNSQPNSSPHPKALQIDNHQGGLFENSRGWIFFIISNFSRFSKISFTAINKLLPELERFLRITLTNEQLSDRANTQREEFLAKLEALNKPPRLPPRPPVNHAGFSATTDYLTKQREISWMQNDPKRSTTPPGAPYRSRRRQPSDDNGAIVSSNLIYAL